LQVHTDTVLVMAENPPLFVNGCVHKMLEISKVISAKLTTLIN